SLHLLPPNPIGSTMFFCVSEVKKSSGDFDVEAAIAQVELVRNGKWERRSNSQGRVNFQMHG
ncbi:MAG: hypothetical protein O7C59_00635, partial [Rickettsia endosymbiont of Ixodes persulcatus]|nr:hypothetical protein [Rickettsia endosymbiont of Ixodes persulcatus]